MKNLQNNQIDSMGLSILENHELTNINGGNKGDAAELIGRSYVWTMAHFLTGGASTIYLIAHNL